jgi:hypothetical protein
MHRIDFVGVNNIKAIILLTFSLLLFSCNKEFKYQITILPVQCHNNPYLDKLLDSLRIEESSNGKDLVNYNYKKGKLDSIDEGDYQHNSKNWLYFANKYNDGRRYNPYNDETARRISRQYLIDNYKLSGNWFDALIIYNCGPSNWKIKASYKSFLFAERILRRMQDERKDADAK